jgi:outer membrane protein assembly factor BamD
MAAVCVMAGCGSDDVLQQLSPQARFDLAMQKFRDEDYLDAEKEFRVVTLQFQGTAFSDDAQYYLGECRYMREEYILSAYEYDILIRSMPLSEYVARARYRKAMCYYNLSPSSYRDQDYTKKAIDELQGFLEYFPSDTLAPAAAQKIQELINKLAQKEFDNAAMYMRMGYFKSAIFYFDVVLEKYHDTQFADQAQLRKSEALFRRKHYAEAKVEIDRFFEKYPKSERLSEAEQLRREILAKLSENTEGNPKVPPLSPSSLKQY